VTPGRTGVRLSAFVRAFALNVIRSVTYDLPPQVGAARVGQCRGHHGGPKSLNRGGCRTTQSTLDEHLLESSYIGDDDRLWN